MALTRRRSVADKDQKSASISWLPLLIGLIGASGGVFLLFPQLTSSRPGGGEPRLTGATFDEQAINAGLWQDPLGVAIADWQAHEHCVEHSVTRFQELVIDKCFANPPVYFPCIDKPTPRDDAHLLEPSGCGGVSTSG
jgi:hypothetical protein